MNITLEQFIAFLSPAIFWIMIATVTLRLLTKKQAVSTTLSWLMLIYLVPFFGLFAYLIFGEITLGRKRSEQFKSLQPRYQKWFQTFAQQEHLLIKNDKSHYRSLFDLCQKQLHIPCITGNTLALLHTPKDIMTRILQDIEQAQTEIKMTFYIWQNGGLVTQITNALIAAAHRGVKIDLLLDSVGSANFFKSADYWQLRRANITITEALYVNLLRVFFSRMDLRQHRKIIVIDNQISYTGSMNMVDPDCFKQSSNVGKWIDIMVRIEGPASTILSALHAWDLEMENQASQLPEIPHCKNAPTDLQNQHAIQFLPTGPTGAEDLMSQALATAIFSAKESIVITTPYFVPNLEIADALKIAALRGVNIDIIVPKKNDSLFVEWASRTFFDDLLNAGVIIHQFDHGLLHTKSVLIDNKLVLVGTVNMDIRSFQLNFEVTMIVDDEIFANDIAQLQKNYILDSQPLDKTTWLARPMYKKVVEKLFFLASPLL